MCLTPGCQNGDGGGEGQPLYHTCHAVKKVPKSDSAGLSGTAIFLVLPWPSICGVSRFQASTVQLLMSVPWEAEERGARKEKGGGEGGSGLWGESSASLRDLPSFSDPLGSLP